MKPSLLASAILLALPLAALADPPPPGWSGSGEVGLAIASGNTKSQNLDAKVELKFNDDLWKDDFYVTAQRNKANVTDPATGDSSYDLTANRYEAGASMGYKFDARSYIVGALRYDHDQFSPYDYQYVASIGYGYQVLKNDSNELSFELGPGYKVIQPSATYQPNPSPPPDMIKVQPDSESNVVLRGKVDYKHSFNKTTAFVNSFVIEAGSGNKYYQNDAGLSVKMTSALALKVAYQIRHNSQVAAGFKKTDQLLTTNLVYSF